MKDPIAYTYEADVHCPDCVAERFPQLASGGEAVDYEGNEIGAIFPWDEWQSFADDGPEILTCGDCLEVIDVVGPANSWVDRATDAYIECAAWADWPTDDHGNKLTGDLSEEALEDLKSDVTEFLSDDETLALLVGLDAGQVGHDFWLTRNRHGAGFWDRGYGQRGDELTKIAHGYGERYLYLGDDGFVYVG